MLKVLELFAGIGACSKALERLGIEHEIVDAVEIDKYAIKSFNAVHGTNFEVQDITKWDKNIEVDLVMHGSPCQDFSVAGKQAGGDIGSGTRSSLMYETVRIVGKLRPKYVIWENVKNVLSKTHKHNFDRYIETMEALGYSNFYKVLDAKDYGVPQHRERVFTVSILGGGEYEFPKKEELKIRLKDILEDEVDEKYYLSETGIKYFENQARNRQENLKEENEKRILTVAHGRSKGANYPADISPTLDTQFSNNWRGVLLEPKCVQVAELDIKGQDCIKRVYSDEGISPTLTSMEGGNRQPKIEVKLPGAYGRDFGSKGKVQGEICDTLQAAMGCGGGNIPLTEEKIIIGSTQAHAAISTDGITPTLTSAMGTGGGHVPMHNYDYRIRKLTPKECWRLMGFGDEDFEKARAVGISNTQLYKQAGNSIVVNVLEKILEKLI